MLAPALKRLDVRAASDADLNGSLALLAWERQKNPWLDTAPDLLRAAMKRQPEGCRACVAERDGELVGFGLYEVVAGTVGAAMIRSLLVAPRSRRAGIGLRLLEYCVADLAARRARVIFAEVPGDTHVGRYRALLLSYGFFEEARIENFYQDGIPQIISRLDL
ncbi:MAG: GNAT family N-acetyltransferase [Gemmatimonadaceae bacterium]